MEDGQGGGDSLWRCRESVYYWMRKLGFEHLKGRLIYVKTRTEIDRIKELETEVRKLRGVLADRVLDHEIDKSALRIACERLGTTVDDLKKRSIPDRSRSERSRASVEGENLRETRCYERMVLREQEGPQPRVYLRRSRHGIRPRGAQSKSRIRYL